MKSETEFELLDRAEEVSVSVRSNVSVVILRVGTILNSELIIVVIMTGSPLMDDSHTTPPMLTSASSLGADRMLGRRLYFLTSPTTL